MDLHSKTSLVHTSSSTIEHAIKHSLSDLLPEPPLFRHKYNLPEGSADFHFIVCKIKVGQVCNVRMYCVYCTLVHMCVAHTFVCCMPQSPGGKNITRLVEFHLKTDRPKRLSIDPTLDPADPATSGAAQRLEALRYDLFEAENELEDAGENILDAQLLEKRVEELKAKIERLGPPEARVADPSSAPSTLAFSFISDPPLLPPSSALQLNELRLAHTNTLLPLLSASLLLEPCPHNTTNATMTVHSVTIPDADPRTKQGSKRLQKRAAIAKFARGSLASASDSLENAVGSYFVEIVSALHARYARYDEVDLSACLQVRNKAKRAVWHNVYYERALNGLLKTRYSWGRGATQAAQRVTQAA